MDITRRGFFTRFVAVVALVTVPWGRALAAAKKKLAIPLSKVPKLQQPGGWALLKVKDKQILFVRESAGSVRALSGKCTHRACDLGYDPKAGRVACTCHGSRFSLDGKVLKGPAEKPLPVFPATLVGDKIILEVDS